MRRNSQHHPHVAIKLADGRVSIHVEHYGRVPNLSAEFSADVLRRAVNKFRRTTQEHRILVAARKLSPVARQCVEAHLIRARALKIEMKMQAKAVRAKPQHIRAEEPQGNEPSELRVERAEYDRQRDAMDNLPAGPRMSFIHHSRDDWHDQVEKPKGVERSRAETLTERANRRLQDAKARAPKVSKAERREMRRALADREESLRDLVDFTPQPEQRRPTLTERAAERAKLTEQPAPERTQRTRERSR